MNNRERRIAKITEALIDENLADDNENNESSDDDFESASCSNELSSSSSDESKSEELQQIDEKELQRQKQEKKKEERIELNSARDALRSRVTKSVIKEEFRMSDEDFTRHIAVIAVWNRMAREKAATQLAMENLQYQQNYEIQQQQQKFTDVRPYTSRISSDSASRTLQAVLELHFGAQTANTLMHHLRHKTLPEDFNAMQEAKTLPDNCDYARLFQAYQRSLNAGRNPERRVVKVSYFDGKLNRFENLDGRIDGRAADQPPALGISQVRIPSLPPELVQGNGTGVRKLSQPLTLSAAAQHQLEILNKTKQAIYQQQLSQLNCPAGRPGNQMFNTRRVPGPVRDESNYVVTPNSTGFETDISFKEEYGKPTASYRILTDPPKRSFFNKYYSIENGVPNYRIMNVEMQTDLVAKLIKNNQILERPEAGDGANAFIYIDTVQFELNKTSLTEFSKLLQNATKVQINRWKGRAGRLMSDFLELLKNIRPDIYALGDDIYISTRKDRENGITRVEKEKFESEREGQWLTADGMYMQASAGLYEIAEVNQDDFWCGREMLLYTVLNGHDGPCLLDQFYNVLPDGTDQDALAQERETAAYRRRFKYIHHVTGEGYNNLEEYRAIEERLRRLEQEALGPVVRDLETMKSRISTLIERGRFQEANQLYERAFELLAPNYVTFTGAELGDQPVRAEFNVGNKVCGSHKFRPID